MSAPTKDVFASTSDTVETHRSSQISVDAGLGLHPQRVSSTRNSTRSSSKVVTWNESPLVRMRKFIQPVLRKRSDGGEGGCG